jgi:putative ABC transport system permease protein
MLLRNPGFTTAAVLCLALGIGATTAIFSVVSAVLFRPLPYSDPERLVRVYSEFPSFPNGGLRKFWISRPEFLELRRDLKAFATLDAWITGGANIAGSEQPVRVTAAFVSGNLLNTLGGNPIRGRVLTLGDDQPAAPQVAVISEGLWKRAFGSDAQIVGRDARLDGRKCTIVGVMPSGFQFPPGEADPAEIWAPLQIDPANPGGRGSHSLYLLGRLQPGMSLAQARDEMNRHVQHQTEFDTPNRHEFHSKHHTLVSFSLHEEVVGGVRPALMALLAAVGFVLLIASVNVANLLLARAETRQREVAVRKAIGAATGKLVRQFVTEGVILSFAGAALGVLFAYGGLKFLLSQADGAIPRAHEVGLDWRVLLFTMMICVGTGIFFGLAPAGHLIGRALHDSLKSGSGRTTSGVESSRLRRAMVVAELSLALILLIGTGLMVRAFWKLQAVNVGMQAAGLLTMRVALPDSLYQKPENVIQFWSAAQERLRRIPGVVSVTASTGLPPIRPLNANDTDIEGFVFRPGGPIENVDFYMGTGDRYFETMQIPLIEGRLFDARDGANAPQTVVVNQTMARTFWPGESAIGHRLRSSETEDWRTIVGVVADVKNAGIDKPTGTELYFPYRQVQGGLRTVNFILRTEQDPYRLANAARTQIQGIDSSLPVANVRTIEDVIYQAQSRPRFLTMLLSIFSGVALVLAALGIYGVIAYSVAQRTTEFGVRFAMGAQPSHVTGLVLRQGLLLGIVGVGAGMAGAFFLTRLLSGMLFGIDSLDPLTFGVMAAALLAVCLLACYLPARRASRVDPMVALRYE